MLFRSRVFYQQFSAQQRRVDAELSLPQLGAGTVRRRQQREHEIGSLEIGKCGDLFLIRKDRLELAGACYDPGSLLATVGFRQSVDLTVVNGCVAVRDGRLTGIDEERLSAECGEEVRRYLGR